MPDEEMGVMEKLEAEGAFDELDENGKDALGAVINMVMRGGEIDAMRVLKVLGVFQGMDQNLEDFVRFVIKTVSQPWRAKAFLDQPYTVLEETSLTDGQKEILHLGDFREGVCRYIVDHRGGLPIIEGGG